MLRRTIHKERGYGYEAAKNILDDGNGLQGEAMRKRRGRKAVAAGGKSKY
jgi:hypothetical protein